MENALKMNNEENSSIDSEKIFEIIQSIQDKLNTSNTSNNNFSSPSDNLNDHSFKKDNNIGNTNDSNFSNDSITSILSNLNIDINTIMKLQRAFSALNQADPRKNLLTSLKPFLRETRQQNIDTYITFLGIINALGSFGENN